MPQVTLQTMTRTASGKAKLVTTTPTVTHNNARLYNHSDGKTYEFVGLDGSGNRIYRDTQKARGNV